jgi:hypothetical protein
LKHCGFCSGCGYLLSTLCSCCPCGGCCGETYWSEWHNDPPRCQDPCNCHGDWIGPSCPSCGPGCCPSCGPGCGPCDGPYSYIDGAYAGPAPGNRQTVKRNGQQNQPNVAQRSHQQMQQRVATRPAPRVQMNTQPNRPIQW